MGIQKSINIEYTQYDSLKELDADTQELLNLSLEASKKAYAPYSNFKVGSSLILENGKTIIGSNQENAAYPSGLCAERVTIFAASANYPNIKIEAIAIYASTKTGLTDIISPCGSCRQVMMEYEDKQNDNIRVLLMNSDKMVWEFNSVASLLPFAFKSKVLKKD